MNKQLATLGFWAVSGWGLLILLAYLLLALFGFAMGAEASPATTCVTLPSLPITFSSATHIEVGVWHEAEAGCDPTGERARPTAGPYEVRYFADGSELLTFLAFEACGRSQADVRWRNDQGELYRYADFIVNAGVDCRGIPGISFPGGSGTTFAYQPPVDGPPSFDPPYDPPKGPNDQPCSSCTIDPHVVLVPEPAAMVLVGLGLLMLVWSRS